VAALLNSARGIAEHLADKGGPDASAGLGEHGTQAAEIGPAGSHAREQRFLRHPVLPDVAIGPCRAWHCVKPTASTPGESPGAQTSDWLRTRPGLGVFQTAGVAGFCYGPVIW
jgi:hypothetical protein